VTSRRQPRSADERGIALVVALLVMTLLTALGMALMLTSQTETLISANYRDSMEGEYVADAGIERVMDDVLTVPDWNTLLATTDGVTAGVTSGFHDTAPSSPITLPDGRTVDLAKATYMINCAKTTVCSDTDMNTSTMDRPWGANNPRYRLYAWGAVNDLIPTGTVNSPYYVAVWIADDPTENDGDPSKDGGTPTDGSGTNPGSGVLTIRAEAFGPNGAHHVIEATISKTDTTEVERGYTGQRGQDEQNRRARKAAVQTPGAGLTRSEMSLSGGLTQQSF
jgi:Tfp pilus assembly protein PilX